MAAALVGAVVAGVVATLLVVTGVVGGGSGDLGADTSEISLPDEVGGLRTVDAVTDDLADGDAEITEASEDRNARTEELTAEAYSSAFDDAATDVGTYADDDLAMRATVVAIRASSAGLAPGVVSDPADLGLARNQVEVVDHGDGVVCLEAATRTVPEGDEVDPDDLLTTLCQKSADGITVVVHGGGTSGTAGRDLMVDVTSDAWDAVS